MKAAAEDSEDSEEQLPTELVLVGSRSYDAGPTFVVEGERADKPDAALVDGWAKTYASKFVLIQDYGLSGTQIELNRLAERFKSVAWQQLTNEGQTIKIVTRTYRQKLISTSSLPRATPPDGRTVRSFDKRAASSYLSKQFRELWTQKKVDFHIEIDGPTLNIFAQDEAVRDACPAAPAVERIPLARLVCVEIYARQVRASTMAAFSCSRNPAFICIMPGSAICSKFSNGCRIRTRSLTPPISPQWSIQPIRSACGSWRQGTTTPGSRRVSLATNARRWPLSSFRSA